MPKKFFPGILLLCVVPLLTPETIVLAQKSPPQPQHQEEPPPVDVSTDSLDRGTLSGAIVGQSASKTTISPSPQIGPARIESMPGALMSLLGKYRLAGDRQSEAKVLLAIATSENALHLQQKSAETLASALGIWRNLGNKEGEAFTLTQLGDVYRGWGFPRRANRFYRDALATYPEADKRAHATTLNNLGLTYFALRDKRKCLATIRDALASYRFLGDHHGEALALSNLGTAYNFLANDPQKAISILQEAVSKLELLGDLSSEANALDNVGEAWLNLRKPEMAAENFQRAIVLYRRTGDAEGETAVRRHMEPLGESGTAAPGR